MYGIQAQSLLPGQPALIRLEDQAAYYLSEIRKIQPKGPYYLLGYCFGGIVAYEIAQQLRALGERVELLGLLDAYLRGHVPQVQWKPHAASRGASLRERLRGRLTRFTQNTRPFSLGRKILYVGERLLARVYKRCHKAALALDLHSVPSFMKITEDINMLAARRYEMRPWPGTITLFRAADQPHPDMPWDLGWSAVAEGGVEVIDVPGGHFALLTAPNIQTLAQRLQEKLEPRDTPGAQEITSSVLATN
jgi:thioesterase domain-containing protein